MSRPIVDNLIPCLHPVVLVPSILIPQGPTKNLTILEWPQTGRVSNYAGGLAQKESRINYPIEFGENFAPKVFYLLCTN